MTAKIVLVCSALVVWAAAGFGLDYLSKPAELAALEKGARADLQTTLDGLGRAQDAWLTTRLQEAIGAAAALSPLKAPGGAAPAARGKRHVAVEPTPSVDTSEAFAARAASVVQRLGGSPLYALIGAKGEVIAGTLWPEHEAVRPEPAVAAALLGTSRISFWRNDKQLFVLAGAPLLGANASPAGALIIARPMGKELCGELAGPGRPPLFAVSLSGGKPVCASGEDGASLAAGGGHPDPVVVQTAGASTPRFVEPSHVGLLAASRPFRPELPGSQMTAAIDLRPGLAAMATGESTALVYHAGLFLILLLFLGLTAAIFTRPVEALTNRLSLALQQPDKPVALDERQYTGPLQRLAKNINALAVRGATKPAPASIESMLGEGPSPPAEPEAPPPTPVDTEAPAAKTAVPSKALPPAKTSAPLFDDDDFAPTVMSAPLPAVMKPLGHPLSAAAPLDLEALTAQPGLDFTLPSAKPAPQPLASPKPVAPGPTLAPVLSAEPALQTRSLSMGSLRFEESSLSSSDDSRFSTLPALPDLPSDLPQSMPQVSGLDADSALSALSGGTETSTLPPEAPGESSAPASPWEEGSGDDPDMPHFEEVYAQFVRTRAQCGEGGDLPLNKFIEKLRKSREQVLQKQGASRVRFQVYVKDGKAALKAVAFR